MSEFLIRFFIKDYEKVKDNEVRSQYGSLSSITGIICNILLFIVKLVMGTLSNSIAIVSDAFNNLSDCFSCVVTLVGYKLAAKPADKDHPFGHGRIEYLSSLVISVLIIVVGLEFLKNSIDKLINPTPIVFHFIVLISLVVSIIVKLWMYLFNKHLGNKINNQTMLATATDSINDSIITTVTLFSLVASLFTDLPVDGMVGIVVAILILKAGYEIIKDTVDTLIGKSASKEVVDELLEIVYSSSVIEGVHDLIIHNYGPGKMFASLHGEVNCDIDILVAHDEIDTLEKKIFEQMGLLAVIHMDPIETNNVLLQSIKTKVEDSIKHVHPDLSIHDFRIVCGESHTNLIFDCVVPFDLALDNQQLKNQIDALIKSCDPNYCSVITFEREFH